MPEANRKVRKNKVVKKTASSRASRETAKKKAARKTKRKQIDVNKLGESAALKVAKPLDTSKADLKKLAGRFDRVDRALAKRDDLPPALLETLSHSSDRITRRNVAANSNCGPKTLMHLAPQFPKEFLANPQIDWMLIENPNSFDRLGENALTGMFKRQDCPEAFLRWAADHKSDAVKLALLSNKRAPKDILERFARSRDKHIAEAAEAHEKLAGEISEDELENIFLGAVRELLENGLSNERQLRYIGLAQFPYVSLGERTAWVLNSDYYIDPNCPAALLPSLLAKVSTSKRVWDRLRAAKHPQCPAEVLKKLAIEKDYEWDHDATRVREAVAKNPKCPPAVLKKLATGSSMNDWQLSDIHVAVAKHPNCPVSLLKVYQSQGDSTFRVAVAKNTSCPLEILRQLASDKTKAVRAAVATNVLCPGSLLGQLAVDESTSVRQSVARNPHCPAAAMEKLAADKDKRVRKIVKNFQSNKDAKSPTDKSVDKKANFQSLVDKLTYRKWSAIRTLLTNEHLSSRLRRKVSVQIAENGSEDVRKYAASEWSSEWLRSRALINRLASDPRPSVRRSVASNSSCPTSVYQQLLEDIDAGVRRDAALNVQHPVNVRLLKSDPVSSPWLLMQLEKQEKKHPGLTGAVREGNILFPAPKTKKALRGSSLVGRILALSQPDIPPAELARSSGYRDWRQRMAIARNRGTPPNILKKLSKDPNRYVAAQADATLHRDEREREALASRVKTAKASKSVNVDYMRLSQWIGERLRAEAGSSLQIGPTQLLHPPMKAWAPYVPFSAWWNPNSLAVGKIQKAWDQLYGSRAPKVVELLQQPLASKDKQLIKRVAESRYCPTKFLLKLSTSRSSAIRRAVASNPNCPASVLKSFVSSRDRNLRQAVAGNRNCPPELLDTLASDDEALVLSALLERQGVSEAIWEKIASHNDWTIRAYTVASSSDCPTSILKRLSADKTVNVRAEVAYNTQCPGNLLKVLANDGSSEVRRNVAGNEGTPSAVLEKLAADKDKEVREQLAWNSATPAEILEQLAKDRSEDVRQSVAHSSYRLPTACLEKLARDKSMFVRRVVASDPRIPAHTLEQLAKERSSGDKGGSVLQSVAGNPSCPPDLLEKMYVSKTKWIGDELRLPNIILGREDCPTDLVEKISQQDESPSVRSRAEAELARRNKNA